MNIDRRTSPLQCLYTMSGHEVLSGTGAHIYGYAIKYTIIPETRKIPELNYTMSY